ncbi:MAG: exonuclease domain-containing protein [Alphaproteobacteria bacterium]|nr:exonuclease domain-containing protein [Alphaproteobacteria bacterium]MBV9692446.1 exonuclease domain-containing protein [Alphaproteobacteria bacterium]
MSIFPQIRAVVFDLEFTAWAGSMAHRWLRPGEFTELVQIGALRVDARSFAVEETLDVLVKPRLNPVLSDYFIALTGIGNEELAARGIDFAQAYARFVEFAQGCTIFAFGRDDLIFEANVKLYGIRDAPAMPRYVNIVPWLIENGIDPKGRNACDVGPLCGVPFEGQKHNALADTRSVLSGIAALVARGARNPLLA